MNSARKPIYSSIHSKMSIKSYIFGYNCIYIRLSLTGNKLNCQHLLAFQHTHTHTLAFTHTSKGNWKMHRPHPLSRRLRRLRADLKLDLELDFDLETQLRFLSRFSSRVSSLGSRPFTGCSSWKTFKSRTSNNNKAKQSKDDEPNTNEVSNKTERKREIGRPSANETGRYRRRAEHTHLKTWKMEIGKWEKMKNAV